MAAFGSILLLAGFTVIVLQYWERLMGDDDSARSRRWIWKCYMKGVAAPVGIVRVVVAAVRPALPPMFGQLGPTPVATVINASAAGLVVISSYWAAITLAWLV